MTTTTIVTTQVQRYYLRAGNPEALYKQMHDLRADISEDWEDADIRIEKGVVMVEVFLASNEVPDEEEKSA